MIQGRFLMDDGTEFYLGTEHGSVFDINPLTSVGATVNYSQGFQSTGVMVTGTTVGCNDRTISGAFTDPSNARSKARQLCRILRPMASGKFYLDDSVYFEFVVEKSPELTYRSHDFVDFELMLFSADPYWYSADLVAGDTCIWVPAFSLPASYDSHTYATLTDGAVTLINAGNADSLYKLTITVLSDCTNIGIQNVDTLEFLELDGSFSNGDVVTVEWVDNSLRVMLNGETNIFSYLTDDSELFTMSPGGNAIKSYAAEGSGYVSAHIEFHSCYTAAVPED